MTTLSDFPAAAAAQTQRLVTVQGPSGSYVDSLLALDASLSAAGGTLAVAYGTAADTAAQGNDSRITGATNASNISSGTLAVGYGGTGQNALAAHGILIGEGTNAVNALVPTAAGQIAISQGATADPAWETMSGDATINAGGTITVASAAGNFTANGIIFAAGAFSFYAHLISGSSFSPTVSSDAGTPTINSATDTRGDITPGAGSTLTTVTFAFEYGPVPVIALTGYSGTAPYLDAAPTATGFVVNTASRFSYLVMG